jgi:hypothetical protein
MTMTMTMTMVCSKNNDHMSIGNNLGHTSLDTNDDGYLPPNAGTTPTTTMATTTTATTMATTMATDDGDDDGRTMADDDGE